MLVVLIILRRKGGAIRASLKAGKRIVVIEDTAVSPTERLRLISVDESEFLMLSAKGQAPVLNAIYKGVRRLISTFPGLLPAHPLWGLLILMGRKGLIHANAAKQNGGENTISVTS